LRGQPFVTVNDSLPCQIFSIRIASAPRLGLRLRNQARDRKPTGQTLIWRRCALASRWSIVSRT